MISSFVKNEKWSGILNRAAIFFEGKLYPLLVALFVLIGHVTGLELYFSILIVSATALALVICPTVKPFIIVLCTFVYQIPLMHSPGDFHDFTNGQVNHDPNYYLRPAVFVTIAILAVIIFSAIAYRFIRYSAPRINPKSPLFLPLLFLSFAFVTNGFFGSDYTIASLAYGIVQVVVFFVFFYLIYYGVESIGTRELVSYLCYLSLLISLVLIGEVVFIYLCYNNVIVNGEIIEEAITLGWGVKNPIGYALASLIPMLIYGAMTEKYPGLYLSAAALTWLATLLTFSRNAMLFSTISVMALLVFACFFGRRKKTFRIITLAAIIVAVIGFILCFDKISTLLNNFLDSDVTSDNGRFALWGVAVKDFLSAPLFGVGFFSFGDSSVDTYVGFLPVMAHNTLFILLSAMGIFGTASYIWYRVKTLMPLIRKPSVEKTAFLISLVTILAMGLLDNFVFYIYTMFYYTVVLVISIRVCHDEGA